MFRFSVEENELSQIDLRAIVEEYRSTISAKFNNGNEMAWEVDHAMKLIAKRGVHKGLIKYPKDFRSFLINELKAIGTSSEETHFGLVYEKIALALLKLKGWAAKSVPQEGDGFDIECVIPDDDGVMRKTLFENKTSPKWGNSSQRESINRKAEKHPKHRCFIFVAEGWYDNGVNKPSRYRHQGSKYLEQRVGDDAWSMIGVKHFAVKFYEELIRLDLNGIADCTDILADSLIDYLKKRFANNDNAEATKYTYQDYWKWLMTYSEQPKPRAPKKPNKNIKKKVSNAN